jgi:hypothetical protein
MTNFGLPKTYKEKNIFFDTGMWHEQEQGHADVQCSNDMQH